jgi:hypothetical protein
MGPRAHGGGGRAAAPGRPPARKKPVHRPEGLRAAVRPRGRPRGPRQLGEWGERTERGHLPPDHRQGVDVARLAGRGAAALEQLRRGPVQGIGDLDLQDAAMNRWIEIGCADEARRRDETMTCEMRPPRPAYSVPKDVVITAFSRSASLTTPFCTRKLWLLTSRCTKPCLWMCATPAAASAIMRSRPVPLCRAPAPAKADGCT